MAPTGDLKNNLEKMLREVRRMKLKVEPDLEGYCQGQPSSYLSILHAAVLHYSLALAKYFISKGYVIYEKSDIKFVHELYQMMRNEFHYHPKLTEVHFLSKQFYAERKMEFTEQFLKFCQEKYIAVTQKTKVASSSRIKSESCLCIPPCGGPKKTRRKTTGRGSDVHPPEVFSMEVHGIRTVWSEHVPIIHPKRPGISSWTYRTFPCNMPERLPPHPLPSYSSPAVTDSCHHCHYSKMRYNYPDYYHTWNGCHSISRYYPQPATSTSEQQHMSHYLDHKPATSTSEQQHMSLYSDHKPATSTSEQQPMSHFFDHQPVISTSEQQPMPHHQPVISTSKQQPMSCSLDHQPVISTSEQQPMSQQQPMSPHHPMDEISTQLPPRHVILNISDELDYSPPHCRRDHTSKERPPKCMTVKFSAPDNTLPRYSEQVSKQRPKKHVTIHAPESSSSSACDIGDLGFARQGYL